MGSPEPSQIVKTYPIQSGFMASFLEFLLGIDPTVTSSRIDEHMRTLQIADCLPERVDYVIRNRYLPDLTALGFFGGQDSIFQVDIVLL